MSYILIVTIAIVIFSLIFDFINGFHDTANAVATAVSTRALTPRTAILLAAVMNFIGALTFTGVAGTITKDIVDPFKLQHGLVVVLAAIIAAIIWNLVTWLYGIPCVNRINCRCSYRVTRIIRCSTLSRFYEDYYRIDYFTNHCILRWFYHVFHRESRV